MLGFICVFGCDNCEDSDIDIWYNDYYMFFEESGDESFYGLFVVYY